MWTGKARRDARNQPIGGALDRRETSIVLTVGPRNRKIAPDGTVTTLAERPGKRAWRTGPVRKRSSIPKGIGTETAGKVYVADCGLTSYSQDHASRRGDDLCRLPRALRRAVDGTGSAAQFIYPCGLAHDWRAISTLRTRTMASSWPTDEYHPKDHTRGRRLDASGIPTKTGLGDGNGARPRIQPRHSLRPRRRPDNNISPLIREQCDPQDCRGRHGYDDRGEVSPNPCFTES